MNSDDYWRRLKDTDWLESVPPSQHDAFRISVESALAGGRGPEALVTGEYDVECIEDDGDYTTLLEQYADASYGKFRPESIDDDVDWESEIATISFTLNGKHFERSFEQLSDYVSDEFDDTLNDILEEAGIQERFFQLPTDDQIAKLTFAKPETLRRAVEAGLLPQGVLMKNKGQEDDG